MKAPLQDWRRRVVRRGRRVGRKPRKEARKAPGERRWTRKRIAIAAAVVAIAALIVLALLPDPIPVDAAAVERGPLSVTVEEEGRTRVKSRFVVAAPITGQMARVRFEPGDFVEAGAVITTMDPVPLTPREREQALAQLEAAEAAVGEAVAAVAQARSNQEQAARELARAERLQPAGALALQELEQARQTVETREAEVVAAEARLEAARADAAAARAALVGASPVVEGGAESVPVRSPDTGRILRVLEKSERVVNAGTAIVEVGSLANLEVVVDVLSSDAVEISVGDPMQIYDWGGDRVISGVVRRVEPSGEEEVSALGIEELRVNVIGELLDSPGPLGDQYRVEARIIVWHDTNALKVPTSALFRIEDAWAVFVIEDGRARTRIVQIGRRGAVEAQVLDGLLEGDVVILYPGEEIEEGTRVEPRE